MNNRSLKKRVLLSGALLLGAVPAFGQDIDLFFSNPATALPPNVLFAIDNSGNWKSTVSQFNSQAITKRDIIHEALFRVFHDPSMTNVAHVGMMDFTTPYGGKVINAVEPLDSTYQGTLGHALYAQTGSSVTIWQPSMTVHVGDYIVPSMSHWNNPPFSSTSVAPSFGTPWAANTSYAIGATVLPSTANGFYYMPSLIPAPTGPSGATEPIWPTTLGGTVTDNGVVWTAYQNPSNPPQHYYKVVAIYVNKVKTVTNGTPGLTGTVEPQWNTYTSGNQFYIPDYGSELIYQDMGTIYAPASAASSNTIEFLGNNANAPYATMLNEAYLYFRGDHAIYGQVSGYDTVFPTIDNSGNYVSPNTSGCVKDVVILIGSGAPDSAENNQGYARLLEEYGKAGLTTTPVSIPLNPNNYQSNWGDEFSAFFTSSGDANLVVPDNGNQPLTVYVIDVYDTSVAFSDMTRKDQAARVYLRSVAQEPSRYYPAGNTNDIINAIKNIFRDVNAKNSGWGSVSLPVSINVKGTNANQVYMGVFRPDLYKNWYGNLKMYTLAYDPNLMAPYLAGANTNSSGMPYPAENTDTGFVTDKVASYWTHTTDPGYYTNTNTTGTDKQWWWWRNPPQGNTATPTSDYEDGNVVEKGGAAQFLREHSQPLAAGVRTVYTCHPASPGGECSPGGLQAFDTNNVSPTDLGLSNPSDTTTAGNIINFIIGANVGVPDGTGTLVKDGPEPVRSKVHGDVLHSRPGTVNYGTTTDDDVVVYYGSNDGMFHAVKGGVNPSNFGGKTYQAGQEIWSFVPPEGFTSLQQLYYNTATNPSATPPSVKPYFADGTVMTMDCPNTGLSGCTAGTHYVYFTMRRGGRSIYALKVNDGGGVAPQIAWHRTNLDSDTQFAELAQTWSEPQIFYYVDSSNNKVPVIVIGAGYDPAEDLDETTGTHDTIGRGVYVLNALNGNIVKFFGPNDGIQDSIAASVTSDGNKDYTVNLQQLTVAYTADTGGNLWKLNCTDPNPTNWTITKMAVLADGTTTGNRKFLYQPDVIDNLNGDKIISIGSGDREHPFDTSVQNYFFMLKDTGDATGWPIQFSNVPDYTSYSASTDPGWKLPLTGSGEKTVGSSITVNGVSYFNTNVPPDPNDTTKCLSLGEARAYQVNILDGTTPLTNGHHYVTVAGGGFLPSPVPATVQFTYVDPTTGQQKTVTQVVVQSGVHVTPANITKYGHRAHTFRYKTKLDD